MKPKFIEERKEVILLLVNAFLEEDGYAHIGLNCLSDNAMGQDPIKIILKELVKDNELEEKTVNGFYRRFIVKNPKPCPEFLFNTHLSITNKTFILRCINFDLDKSLLNDPYYLKEYFNNETEFVKRMLYQIKKGLGESLESFLNKPLTYKTSIIYNEKFPLIKTENGYQVDSEKHTKREYKLSKPNIDNVGMYVYGKIIARINGNYERFGKSTITVEQINELYKEQKGLDYYTNEPFDCIQDISADRIDSDLPYDKSNIVLTHNKINMMKGKQSAEEFIQSCKLVANKFS